MKKLFTLVGLCFLTATAIAQITNPGMEDPWRTNTAGGIPFGPSYTVQAPYGWYGFDSLAIALGEEYVTILAPGGNHTNWHQQIFQESTHIHGGNYAARIVTRKQDTLGELAGVLANCETSVDVNGVMSGEPIQQAVTYSGGTYVNTRIMHVSAWVEYYTPGGANTDSGALQVIAAININGQDSVVGTGVAYVDFDTTGFTQVQASIYYPDPNVRPDTIRIFFASSASQGGGVDSSVLYVDDVTMDSLGLSVSNIAQQNIVTVYPNPTSGVVHLTNATNATLSWKAYAMNGQLVSEKLFTGNDDIDLSILPDGIYFYDIADKNSVILQRGKLSIVK